jgi:hypothetical protein
MAVQPPTDLPARDTGYGGTFQNISPQKHHSRILPTIAQTPRLSPPEGDRHDLFFIRTYIAVRLAGQQSAHMLADAFEFAILEEYDKR